MTTLRVVVDGTPMANDEAIAFWKRFSAWMEEHPSDLAGFARSESLTSVHPEMHDGAPVLVASRTTAQKPYTAAPKRSAGPRPRTSASPSGKGPRRGGPRGSSPSQRVGGERKKAPR